jgi:iron complex outermembrane receptor protein
MESQGAPELYYPEPGLGTATLRDGQKAGNMLATLSYADFTLQGAYSTREKDIPTAPFGTIFNDPNTQVEDEHAYVHLSFKREVAQGLEVYTAASYQYWGYEGVYPFDNAPNTPAVIINRDESTGQQAGFEAKLTQELFNSLKLTAGGEYRNNFERQQITYDEEPAALYLDDNRPGSTWGVYGQGDWRVLTNLIVNAGLRYDDYGEFGDTLNPRVAVIYRPVEKTSLKFLYGTAFRAPNVFEAYYNDGAIGTVIANPELDPETITTYEVVLEQKLPAHHTFLVAPYYYEINDLINQVEVSPGVNQFVNLAEVKAYGLETEVEGRYFLDGEDPEHSKWTLRARVSYAIQRAEDIETDSELSNSPRHLLKANFVVPIYQDKFLGGLEFLYSTDVLLQPGKTQTSADDHLIINATLFNQKLAKGLEWSVSVYNLLDHKWEYPAGSELIQNVIPQNGRTFQLKVTYRF